MAESSGRVTVGADEACREYLAAGSARRRAREELRAMTAPAVRARRRPPATVSDEPRGVSRRSRSTRLRLAYALDRSLSRGPVALIGWLALLSAAVVMTGAAALVLLGLRPADAESLGVAEATWQALMRALDAGAVGADVGWPFRAVMLLVTIGGLFILSTLIGVLTTGIEGRLELVAGDVEVREVVVLLLDLDVALGEVRVLELDLVEPLAHRGVFALQPLDPREQLAAQLVPVGRVLGGGLLLVVDLHQVHAQALVLPQQLSRELRSPLEQGQELVRALEDLRVLAAHTFPFAVGYAEPVRPPNASAASRSAPP